MPEATANCRLEPGGIRVFRSSIAPFSHKNARKMVPSHEVVNPTMSLRELMASAELEQSPKCPRSVATPFLQRKASDGALRKVRVPIISPALLIPATNSGLPPIELVVRSVRAPCSQRKAWQLE